MDSRRRAFSLTEILVVTTIIAVLAAILFPVIASARRSAARATCFSNERQIGLAMFLYTEQNDDAFPFGDLQPGIGWALALQPGLKSTAVLRCPADPTQDDAPGPRRFVDSYALNANLGGATFRRSRPGLSEVGSRAEASLLSPSKTIMFFEASDNVTTFGWAWPRTSGAPDSDASSPSGNTTTRPGIALDGSGSSFLLGDGGQYDYAEGFRVTRYATGDVGGRKLNGNLGSVPRHAGRANYLACDGHAVALRPAEVSGGEDALDPSCDQGTIAGQAGPCAAQRPVSAAGTASARYSLTFSVR